MFVAGTQCSGNQSCENGACIDPTCSGGCTTPPGAACADANSRVTYAGAGTCNNGTCSYATTLTSCAYGCQQGVCLPAPTCTPESTRCNGTQVETCNINGSAWLFTENCPSTCTNGLCDAPCTPGAARCNGNTVETCNGQGTQWVADPSGPCAQGCVAGVCIQSDLTVSGNTVYMDGEYHFSHAVVVQNGGTIQVGWPDGGQGDGQLTIYAPSIDVEPSSHITGGASVHVCEAPPDNVANGIRLYASSVQIDGDVTWNTVCTLDGVVVRADTINGSGTVTSSGRNLLLYGTGGVASGLSAPGATKSLMPPFNITSSTHPWGGIYNDNAPPPVFSWDRPYSTVGVYRYTIGTSSATPTQTSTPVYAEALTLGSPLNAGTTYLDVISVDTNGIAGTVPHEFMVFVNNSPPSIDSPSNPNQGTYTTNSAVTVHWAGGIAGVGYYYVLDHFPDTLPDRNTGTFESATLNPSQVFLPNVADGQWFFHIIAYDTMGYPTLGAEHFEIDIGSAPQTGTIAGTVKDAVTNTPIANATVVVQRGLHSTTTDSNGVYTFNNLIPAGSYEVVASASGYQSVQATLSVTGSTSTNQYFTLQQGSGCPNCTDLCSGISCPNAPSTSGCVDGQNIPLWNATCSAGACFQEYTVTGGGCPNNSPCNSGSQCQSGACMVSGVCGAACTSSTFICSTTDCCYGLISVPYANNPCSSSTPFYCEP
jgi:hypothetical protein